MSVLLLLLMTMSAEASECGPKPTNPPPPKACMEGYAVIWACLPQVHDRNRRAWEPACLPKPEKK